MAAFWQLFFQYRAYVGTGSTFMKKRPSYIKLLTSMDRRLSELPNHISTQDLTHRSSGDIHGQSPSPEI